MRPPGMPSSSRAGAAGSSATDRAGQLRRRADELEQQAQDLMGRADRARRDAANWERGADGERAVGRLLDVLTDRGWVVLHDRRKPRTVANLDHVLVGPPGVVVVDSKNWSGPVMVTSTDLFSGAWSRNREVDAVLGVVSVVAEEVRRRTPAVPVLGAIAFAGDAGLPDLVHCRRVAVGSASQVVAWALASPPALSAAQVRHLAEDLERVFVPHVPPPRRGGGAPPRRPTAPPRRPATAPFAASSRRRGPGRVRRAATRRARRLLVPLVLLGALLVALPGLLDRLGDEARDRLADVSLFPGSLLPGVEDGCAGAVDQLREALPDTAASSVDDSGCAVVDAAGEGLGVVLDGAAAAAAVPSEARTAPSGGEDDCGTWSFVPGSDSAAAGYACVAAAAVPDPAARQALAARLAEAARS